MGPLEDVVVVEMGHALAGPLAGTFLADFGADVIKVERPGGGDSLRDMGPKQGGVGVWWLVAGRNKRSVTIDVKAPGGIDVLRDLLRDADVLIENYRPGVMEKLGLSWDELHALNPRLVMLRISGFGQTGPYSGRGGFGKIGEAYSGATNLTGHRDQPPVHPSYSLGDAVCALAGAYGVALALLARHASGEGQLVDLALYEPMFRLIEWQIPLHVLQGMEIERNGPRFPFSEAFVTDVCPTADGDNVVVAAATSESLERLRRLLEAEGAVSGRPSTDELAEAMRAWIAHTDRDAVLARFERENLVGGLVFTPAEMLTDPHMRARENIIELEDDRVGRVPVPNVVPTLRETPGAVRWLGPELGEHTDAVLRGRLGYDDARMRRLRDDAVIAPAGRAAEEVV